ncbi:MAG TPA: FecR family protein [Puia sp.]|nr:FecR family protein [Puia sp.]
MIKLSVLRTVKGYFRNKPGAWVTGIIIIILGTGIYFLLHDPVRPGSCRAAMFSVGGAPRVIDDYKKGVLYIIHNDDLAAKDKYITLYTPRGGDFSVLFPDSTTVWLNAQSTIRYPANFSQYSIELTVKGEAYIEVARNPSPRLRISVGSVLIESFGAHMNIRSYPEDPAVITMVAGSAKIWLDQKFPWIDGTELTLRPSEQAKLSELAFGEQVKLMVTPSADDLNDIIDWKNGNTSFHNASIQTIMHSVSRWYDVDIIYKDEIPDKKYTISLPRSAPLEQLLSVLRKQGGIFSIQGKTVTVMK